MSIVRRFAGIAVCAGLLVTLFPERSFAAPPTCTAPDPAVRNERVTRTSLRFRGATYRFNALVPPGYHESTRRYPVLYLLHGGTGQSLDSWLSRSDLLAFTEQLPPDRQAIVVTPDAYGPAIWSDWPDGEHLYESFHFQALMPYIDRHYRTIPDRAHRAVAGLSSGALGALNFAAHRPDLFAASGGFSGAYGTADPELQPIAAFLSAHDGLVCAGYPAVDVFGPAGPIVTDEVWWRNQSPIDVAQNLRGVRVYVASGDGVPCDEADQAETAAQTGTTSIEALLHEETVKFDRALDVARIEHLTDLYGCGIHSWRYWQRGLHRFWTFMFDSFGRSAPTAFDYRSAEPTFDVWGWRFRAQAERAPEFLDVASASQRGVSITGSGLTSISTDAVFPPRQRVSIEGAVERSVAADSQGRLDFHVDLGAPHRDQQYTLIARAKEARGGYFVSRTVAFRSASGP